MRTIFVPNKPQNVAFATGICNDFFVRIQSEARVEQVRVLDTSRCCHAVSNSGSGHDFANVDHDDIELQLRSLDDLLERSMLET